MQHAPQPAPSPRRRLPSLSDRRFGLITGVIVLLLAAVFAFGSPIGSGADEPVHVIRAAGAVHGSLGGAMTETPSPGPGAPNSIDYPVTVPQSYAEVLTQPDCYAFHPQISASCREELSDDQSTSSASTYVASYPPVYYLIVGLPSLVLPASQGVFVMRLMSAAMASALLALGLVSARRTGGPILVSVAALAVTPMVIHMASIVNPTGTEMAASFATWLTAIALLREATGARRHGQDRDDDLELEGAADDANAPALHRSSLIAFTVAATTLIAVRPSGIVVMAVITVCCLTLLATTSALRFLLAQRPVRVCAAVVTACAVAIGAWIVWAKSGSVLMGVPVPGLTTGDIVLHTFEQQAVLARQMVGVFGWLDAALPGALWKIWIGVAIALVVAAFALGTARQRVALVVTTGAAVMLPPMSQVTNAAKYGYIWSGRYQYPFAVGLLLVAGCILATQLPRRRSAVLNHWAPLIGRIVIAMFTAVGLVIAHVVNARRYGTGTRSDALDYLTEPQWIPVVSTRILLVAAIVLAAAWGAWTGICLPRRRIGAETATHDPQVGRTVGR